MTRNGNPYVLMARCMFFFHCQELIGMWIFLPYQHEYGGVSNVCKCNSWMFSVRGYLNPRSLCIGGKCPFHRERISIVVFVLSQSYAEPQPKPIRILSIPGVTNPNNSVFEKNTRSPWAWTSTRVRCNDFFVYFQVFASKVEIVFQEPHSTTIGYEVYGWVIVTTVWVTTIAETVTGHTTCANMIWTIDIRVRVFVPETSAIVFVDSFVHGICQIVMIMYFSQ